MRKSPTYKTFLEDKSDKSEQRKPKPGIHHGGGCRYGKRKHWQGHLMKIPYLNGLTHCKYSINLAIMS